MVLDTDYHKKGRFRTVDNWIYTLAARDGAPQAVQVADRWHLLKNIGDALERMMYGTVANSRR
ncbi:hypothetical protein ACJCHP_004691 [Enterobacter asburiae]